MAIPMLKIRRPLGRLIFNMGIAIPGKTVFLIETAPRVSLTNSLQLVSNPSDAEPGTFKENQVNITAADVLLLASPGACVTKNFPC